MSRLEVENKVRVYEVDDTETDSLEMSILVRSHWNRNELVVLKVGAQSVTVVAADLTAAIANATNTGGI